MWLAGCPGKGAAGDSRVRGKEETSIQIQSLALSVSAWVLSTEHCSICVPNRYLRKIIG